MENLIAEINNHIKVIHELSGVQYVLRKDSKYGWALYVQLRSNIRVLRGSLERLNEELTDLEYSARYWYDYLDEDGTHVKG